MPPPVAMPSTFKYNAHCRALTYQTCCTHKLNNDNIIDTDITWAEEDLTSLTKTDTISKY
jgi:hypothetical protein